MARQWEFPGPEQDRLSVKEVALLFGYDVKSWMRLVKQGHFPRPRGVGQNRYYTGGDVAVITDMAGRWGPQEGAADDEEAEG